MPRPRAITADSAPTYIYSKPVVDTIPKGGVKLPPERFHSTTTKLLDIIIHNTDKNCLLLPVPHYFFKHSRVETPDLPEFSGERAWKLHRDQAIEYKGVTYHPTAWKLYRGRVVPYEFVRSDLMSEEAKLTGRNRALWRAIEKEADSLSRVNDLSLRLLHTMLNDTFICDGAFQGVDTHDILDYLENPKEWMRLSLQEQLQNLANDARNILVGRFQRLIRDLQRRG